MIKKLKFYFKPLRHFLIALFYESNNAADTVLYSDESREALLGP